MINNKNLIEYHIIPIKKTNLRSDTILYSLAFIKNADISITQDWINFGIDENIQLSISKNGSINITTRAFENQIDETINLLDKLAKKVISHLALTNQKFLIELCVIETKLINFENYLKHKFEMVNPRIINYKLNSKIKTQIMKLDDEYVISIKGENEIEKIKEAYLNILAGNINQIEDLKITNSVLIKTLA
ncbi:MAG: hypothetical protein OIN87_11925 [Candidatus Methanoperedens sp.]|nr:hypothetical protein [Candidatus Methanoperedens sp.]